MKFLQSLTLSFAVSSCFLSSSYGTFSKEYEELFTHPHARTPRQIKILEESGARQDWIDWDTHPRVIILDTEFTRADVMRRTSARPYRGPEDIRVWEAAFFVYENKELVRTQTYLIDPQQSDRWYSERSEALGFDVRVKMRPFANCYDKIMGLLYGSDRKSVPLIIGHHVGVDMNRLYSELSKVERSRGIVFNHKYYSLDTLAKSRRDKRRLSGKEIGSPAAKMASRMTKSMPDIERENRKSEIMREMRRNREERRELISIENLRNNSSQEHRDERAERRAAKRTLFQSDRPKKPRTGEKESHALTALAAKVSGSSALEAARRVLSSDDKNVIGLERGAHSAFFDTAATVSLARSYVTG